VASLAGAVPGAVLFGLAHYGNAQQSWDLLAQGKSFCGGLVGGAIAAWVFLRFRRLSVAKYGDVLVTALALGYAIGRIGCFLNGCDYGVTTGLPWAVQYPAGSEAYSNHLARGWIPLGAPLSLPVHPVQLYAAVGGLVIFLVLWRWKAARPGQRICLFALFYGAYRFGVEWLRGDFRPLLGPFSLPQLLGLFLVAGALSAFCRRWRKVHLPGTSLHNCLTRVA
jgi:phosphatidylglycerol:prolipoprotein diacylglycerol transferase